VLALQRCARFPWPGVMHALGPTSRSLMLVESAKANRDAGPWLFPRISRSFESHIPVDTRRRSATRVAPSFLRVGNLELFALAPASEAHPVRLNETAIDHGPPD